MIAVTPEQVDAVLGISVPRSEMKRILQRLDFGVDKNASSLIRSRFMTLTLS